MISRADTLKESIKHKAGEGWGQEGWNIHLSGGTVLREAYNEWKHLGKRYRRNEDCG